MQLVRLLYFSRNRIADLGSPIEGRLEELMATCRTDNGRDGVTGVLVHDENWFVQVLEGVDGLVSRTFERILRDPRHCDVTLVAMRPVTARRFGAAPMAGIAWGKDNADIFRHYAEGPRFDPRLMSADRLADLVEALLKDAAKCPTKSRTAFRGTPWTIGNATNAA
jgi:hypothetical protein